MGWWDESIMGGDTPLDYQGLIVYDTAEINQDEFYDLRDNNPAELAKRFEAKLDKMVKVVKENRYSDNYIAKQVLGVLIMEAGVQKNELCQKALTMAIKGAEEELADEESLDNWRDREAREASLRAFIEACKNYDGTPTEIPTKGLFEKIADRLSQS